tara:strand:- start:150 stop:422 length:273 start_codon:yes stop_codon:yes gene_type:complete
MDYTDVKFTRESMKNALLTGATPEVGRRSAKSKFPKQRDYLADAKRRLLEYAKERRDKPEGSSDWTSYTDFQDYKPPPTDYSYLSRNYGG